MTVSVPKRYEKEKGLIIMPAAATTCADCEKEIETKTACSDCFLCLECCPYEGRLVECECGEHFTHGMLCPACVRDDQDRCPKCCPFGGELCKNGGTGTEAAHHPEGESERGYCDDCDPGEDGDEDGDEEEKEEEEEESDGESDESGGEEPAMKRSRSVSPIQIYSNFTEYMDAESRKEDASEARMIDEGLDLQALDGVAFEDIYPELADNLV